MVIRILMLLFALALIVNLVIIACCYITGINLYEKYGKQMVIGVCLFAVFVAAIYVAVAFIGLKL